MFYKMLFDRFVGFAYLYTVLDMPRQIRIVCLHKVTVLCFVNNGKTQHRARATLHIMHNYCHVTLVVVSNNLLVTLVAFLLKPIQHLLHYHSLLERELVDVQTCTLYSYSI